MFGWESEKERLLRLAKIPPKKKLEWLRQMNEFMAKCAPKNIAKIKKFKKIK
jgi:hypothetical protein